MGGGRDAGVLLIVFLTYDLHGQWDSGNAYANPGCPTGNCLRSDVNLTETINSLSLITKAGVPSNKVVVGVTSYGRSFQMTTPGCTTETCTFTGAAGESEAKPGRCTGTAGILSDAEIREILSDSSRVTTSYVDASSNKNILVYDEVQWVGYMDQETLATRTGLYKSLKMGGTTNWAIDQESFMDVPGGVSDWNTFVLDIKSNMNPLIEGDRTGNWTMLQCTDPAVVGLAQYTPSERWGLLDCDNAWADAVAVWKNIDEPAGNLTFPFSIANTFHVGENSECENLLKNDYCNEITECVASSGSGPAGYLVWGSLTKAHAMYANFYNALSDASGELALQFKAYEDAFTPLPTVDDEVTQLLLDLVGLLGTLAAGVYFDEYLTTLPSFFSSITKDTVKDSSLALIAGTTSIAKDVAAGATVDSWTPEKEDDFAAYMGQVILGWQAVTEATIYYMFHGEDSAISILTEVISNGRLIEGSYDGHAGDSDGYGEPTNTSSTALQIAVHSAFWAYTIPIGWSLSGTHPVILDSGFDCSTTGNPLNTYLSDGTASSTRYCDTSTNTLYYLVAASGQSEICTGDSDSCTSSFFQPPLGLNQLDGVSYGNLTLEKLILGSINTYQANGNTNGGGVPDIGNSGTVNDLYSGDITTAGFIRIPVCTAQLAFYNWDTYQANSSMTSNPAYPCLPPKTDSDCGSSSFTDETSSASPTVSDCQQLAETSSFPGLGPSIQAASSTRLRNTAPDIIDIINSAVSMYGGDGQVGAKGTMSCNGDATQQKIEWGIY
ncbi:glycosyl hydrolases family 18-domain-containing protein [Xylaria arbuscula]|nr:glycosyl hydrolases family 18-domain-containing protein [Xylaria arbuscula]